MSYCIINQFILFFPDFSQQFGYFCSTMMIFSLESFVLSFAFYCLCYRFIGIAPLPLSLTSSVLLVALKKFPHLSFSSNEVHVGPANSFPFLVFPLPSSDVPEMSTDSLLRYEGTENQ